MLTQWLEANSAFEIISLVLWHRALEPVWSRPRQKLTQEWSVVGGEAVGDRAVVVEEGLLPESELVVDQVEVGREEEDRFGSIRLCWKNKVFGFEDWGRFFKRQNLSKVPP